MYQVVFLQRKRHLYYGIYDFVTQLLQFSFSQHFRDLARDNFVSTQDVIQIIVNYKYVQYV